MGCTYKTKGKEFQSKQEYINFLKSKMVSIDPDTKQDIVGVSDLSSMLFNTKLKSSRQYRRQVYKRSFVSQVKNNKGSIRINGKLHEFENYDSSWDDQTILNEIEKKGLITEALKSNEKIADNFVNWVNEGAPMENENRIEFFGKNYKNNANYSIKTLNRIKNYFGIQKGDTIMTLDDFLQSSPAAEPFSDMDNTTLEGHNTYIVVHGYTDGVADISIVNIEPDLFFQGKGLEGKYWTSKFVSDKEAKSAGIDMMATMSEIRSLQTSLLIAKMKKAAGNKLSIRRQGSIALSPFKDDAKFSGINVYQSLKNLKSLRNLPEVLDNFSDNMIADIYDDTLMDINMIQDDYINMLLTMHQQRLESLGQHRITAIERMDNLVKLEKAFKADRNHTADLIKALRLQQEYLKKRKDLDSIEKMIENDEYRIISQFIFDLEKVYDRSRGDISAPNWFERIFATEGHLKNWILQQYTNFEKQILMESSKLVAQEQEKLVKYLEPVNGIYIKNKPGRNVLQYFVNDSQNKMENMFKRKKMKVKRGDKIVEEEVFTGDIHWTLDDPETARLYSEGKIKDEELELGEYVATKSMEYIEKILFQHIYKQSYADKDLDYTITKKDKTFSIRDKINSQVEEIMEKNWTKGMLPLLQKNASEYISAGKLKKGFDAFFSQELDPAKIFDQVISMNDEGEFQDSIGSFVINQIMDGVGGDKEYGSDSRLKALGFVRQEEGIVMTDESQNNGVTRDIFTIMSYMAAEAQTKSIIENELLPFLQDAKIYAKAIETFEGIAQDNTLKWLDVRIDKTVFGRSQSIAKADDKAGKTLENTTRLAMRFTTFSGVALSVPVGVTSFTANYFETLQMSIANSLSNPYDMFTFKEFNKANIEVIKNMTKVSILADEYQIYEGEMVERQNNPKYNPTKKDIWNSNAFHFMNRGTDKYFRMVIMVAQMMHDGTYDAHTVNDNGEVEYDAKKDERFFYYDAGEYKQTKKQKALMDWYIDDLKKDRTVNQSESDVPVKGYTFKDQETFIFIGNEFVVGAFDQYRGTAGDNYVLYNVVMQFKKFFVPKFQARLGTKRTVKDAALRKLVEGDDGELRRLWEPIIREGSWTSTGRMLGERIPIVNDILKKIDLVTEKRSITDWRDMTDLEKHNLARAGMDLIFLLAGYIMYNGLKGLGDDDDDKKGVPLGFVGPRLLRSLRDGLWTAVVAAQVNEMFLQPFPVVESAKRWLRLVSFDASNSDIKSITPGAANVTAVQDIIGKNE